MGFRENERAMIAVILKVREVQDFALPRKRGRPKKQKGRTKA